MTTNDPTSGSMLRNEAAERLRAQIEHDQMIPVRDLDAALAEERRHVIEQIYPYVEHRLACNLSMSPEVLKPGRHVCTCGLQGVLDELTLTGSASDLSIERPSWDTEV